MFLSPSRMYATINTYISTYTFYAGIVMLLRSIAKELIPENFKSYFVSIFHHFFPPPLSHKLNLIIDSENIYICEENEIYEAAKIYLNTKINNPQIKRLQMSKTPNQKNVSISIDKSEVIVDSFEEIDLIWKFIEKECEDLGQSKSYYELSFEKQFEEQVISSYLPYIIDRAYAIKMEQKIVKLFSLNVSDRYNSGDIWWESIVFKHPTTFDTLGIDPEVKKMIMNDLCRFLRRKQLYKNVGKPWKRGYLLYGPPGTGKTSLIAAMANYLHFDIYYLQISLVRNDRELETLLSRISNRSMLVVEDIDCNSWAIDQDRSRWNSDDDTTAKLSLAGVLSCFDGFWSSCGMERIIVVTTNHMERVDPALFRPGRIDMHIHVSFCTSQGFKFMVSKYFGSEGNDHYLCKKIEELIDDIEVTPGEVAGELLRDEEVDGILQKLVQFLEDKKIRNKSREIFKSKSS